MMTTIMMLFCRVCLSTNSYYLSLKKRNCDAVPFFCCFFNILFTDRDPSKNTDNSRECIIRNEKVNRIIYMLCLFSVGFFLFSSVAINNANDSKESIGSWAHCLNSQSQLAETQVDRGDWLCFHANFCFSVV